MLPLGNFLIIRLLTSAQFEYGLVKLGKNPCICSIGLVNTSCGIWRIPARNTHTTTGHLYEFANGVFAGGSECPGRQHCYFPYSYQISVAGRVKISAHPTPDFLEHNSMLHFLSNFSRAAKRKLFRRYHYFQRLPQISQPRSINPIRFSEAITSLEVTNSLTQSVT